MIDIYNHNLEDKTICSKSGSSSPLWLSPVLNRRVRKQSAEYQEKITKSNSSHEITQEDISFNAQTDDEQVTICDVSIEEPKSEEKVLIEEPIIVKEAFQISTGAIPKKPKFQVEVIVEPEVRLRDDSEKPKTPLSERALKIRQAKEAFFRAPIPSTSSSNEQQENYRLSQISIGSFSTISNSIENVSSSTSAFQNPEITSADDASIKTSSLTQNTDDGQDSSKNSNKFGLATIATKLRKVKLKKGTKEVQKMNTIPVLCRQSLNVDLFKDSEPVPKTPEKANSAFRFKKNKERNVKKSKSLGLL